MEASPDVTHYNILGWLTYTARMKNGRFKREHKGKHQRTQPRAWVPATVPPNPTAGVFTRAGRTLVAEYEQQRENDDTILGVLAHFEGGNDEAFVDLHALESQHTPGSMGTCNIDLWKTVFRDDAWRTTTPIRKTTGFGATHPGGGGRFRGQKHRLLEGSSITSMMCTESGVLPEVGGRY
jgi:hypothetical protein